MIIYTIFRGHDLLSSIPRNHLETWPRPKILVSDVGGGLFGEAPPQSAAGRPRDPLVMTRIAIEHGHRNSEFSH